MRVRLTSSGNREHELTYVGETGVFDGTVPDICAGIDYGYLLDDPVRMPPWSAALYQRAP